MYDVEGEEEGDDDVEGEGEEEGDVVGGGGEVGGDVVDRMRRMLIG